MHTQGLAKAPYGASVKRCAQMAVRPFGALIVARFPS